MSKLIGRNFPFMEELLSVPRGGAPAAPGLGGSGAHWLGPSLEHIPKLRMDRPITWEHHCGGWRDVVRLIHENLHTQEGTLFLSAVETEILHFGAVTEPWVGFIHQAPRHDLPFPDLERLVALSAWKESLQRCKGLFTLTDYQRRALRALGVEVPIAVVRYPMRQPAHSFRTPPRVRRTVCMIGEYLRRYQDLYDLRAPGWDKILLDSDGFREARPGLHVNDTVRVLPRLEDDVYRRLFDEAVVFLSLEDGVANTTVLECLIHLTPLLVNAVGAIPEYLGAEYPLYFSSLEEAAAKLQDEALLAQAVEYLEALPARGELSEDHFLAAIQNTAIYRSLRVPAASKGRFAPVDLSVVMCSYRRVQTLPRVLKAFCEQDFDGSFELILWNNNLAQRDAVDRAVAAVRDRLDVKVVHSSENYYCGIRMAVPALARSDLLLLCDDDVVPNPLYIETFLEAYRRHGPEAVICARGHEFLPHQLDEDHPERVWEGGQHLRFHDESAPECHVHFMHADNCLIPTSVMARAAAYRMERHEDVLVDDYWLSFVLCQMAVSIVKIKADEAFSFLASSDDPEIALFLNPAVAQQRISFYVRHMRAGWPFPVPLPG